MKNNSLTTENTETLGSDDILFDAAFNEAIGFSKEEPTKEEPTKEEPTKEEPTKEEPTKEEPTKEESTKEESTKEEPTKEEPTKEVSTSTAQDEEIARLKAGLAELQKAKEVKPEEKKEVKPSKTNEEWEQFKKDWPEVADVIEGERKKVQSQVEEYIKKALEPFEGQLQNLTAKSQESEIEKFVREVEAVHPEAVKDLPKVLEWAKKQPAHLRIGIEQILENSNNPKDVIAIYDTYKAANGIKPKEELKSDNKEDVDKTLRKMETIKAKRTASTTDTVDENDFDGAFEQAVRQIK